MKKKKVPDANFGCLVSKGGPLAVLSEQLLAERARASVFHHACRREHLPLCSTAPGTTHL